jgi:3-deoxy-D-manno-octulosonic-acid transferase
MGWAHRAYRLALRILLPAWLAALWWLGRKQSAYREGLHERMGLIEVQPNALGGVLVHATSVGEMQAAQALLKALLQRLPQGGLTVSCQTPTGADTFAAMQLSGVRRVYWPIDAKGCVSRFLDRLQPRLVILLEREIWPEMMAQCRERAISVAIVNARLAPDSERSYQRMARLMKPIWTRLAVVAAADEASARRYRALGVPPDRVTVTGNIKFDAPDSATPRALARLPPMPNLSGHQVLVAGSTHEVEEQGLLDAWPAFHARHPDSLLVLVPRHPQRFEAVAKALEQRKLPFIRRSLGQAMQAHTQIILGDTMGELPAWYSRGQVCFIGGSVAPIGGHNALEALSLGKPVLFGPHTHNFEALYQEVRASQAGQMVHDATQVFDYANKWLGDTAAWQAMSQAAAALFARNQGACVRSLQALEPLLPLAHAPSQAIASLDGGDRSIWWDAAHFDSLSPEHFTAARWNSEAIVNDSGRGKVHRFAHQGRQYLLRHYRRGGLAAKLAQDSFWRQPTQQSRAMKELIMLRVLRGWNLPVPLAVAVQQARGPLRYRADIVLAWIEGSRNLVQLLRERALSPSEWSTVGQAVGLIHQHQAFHADLNAHNLLLDDKGLAWVVDFDKCYFRGGEEWKARNLARLLRSLRKESSKFAGFQWQESDWQLFLNGYHSSTDRSQASQASQA